jgi:hypothetical protein
MENTSVRDQQNAPPQSMLEESSGGVSMAPPQFNLTAGAADGGDTPIQRQEADPETTTLGADPIAQLQDPEPASAENDWAGIPDSYRDPISNSNTALTNLQLLVAEWEGRDGTGDDRKLAYILATAMHETGGTGHAIHEGLNDNYWPSHYANTGFWGRGFVQLTWEDNYEGMEDETGVALADHKEAALLPAVSAIVTVDGMIDGDFSPAAGPLNDYIPVNDDAEGNPQQEEADYEGARRTVNGTDRAADIAESAEEFATAIAAYRAGIADGSITDQSISDYLYHDTTLYTGTHEADANRITESLGYHSFGGPSFGADATAGQTEYRNDVMTTGYTVGGYRSSIQRINSDSERGALIAFQTEFNANHNLETPLPENGTLDDATLAALTRAGNLIRSGENMIDYAFGGDVAAINPVTQIFDQFQAGTTNMTGLAQRLVYLMPVPNAADVTNMFDTLGGDAANLAFNLAINAPSHDSLAFFNRPILDRMQALLNASTNPQHHTMGRRIQCLFDYGPAEAQHVEYRVASGDSMSRIAARNNMTLDALMQYNADNGNPIADAGRIDIGDLILLPNLDFDADAAGGTQTCELAAFPLPAVEAPVVEGPVQESPGVVPGGEGAEQGNPDVEAQIERMKGIFQSISDWISGLMG